MKLVTLSAAVVLSGIVRLQAVEPPTHDFSGPLEQGWKVADGNWSLRDGRAVAEGKFCRLEKKDFTGQDVEVTADVAYVHDAPHAAAGIQVRLADDGTGYAAGLREIERGVDTRHGPWERPLVQLFRMEAGGWKLLQEAKVMNCRSGEMRKLKVQCKGSDIFVYYEDMQTPVIREFDENFQRPGRVALWKDTTGSAMFDNAVVSAASVTPQPSLRTDWSWVKGAIYVRSDAVNSVEMWHDYWDHVDTLDRELAYASAYGFNMVQVYLHWIVWDRHGEEYLKRIDDFLTRADWYGLKANLIFWDDCGHVEPSLDFKPPMPGRHNSQMMPNPSHRIRDNRAELEAHREKFRAYVQGIAGRFKDDRRISFWQLYNEAMGAKETYRTSETDANIDTLLRWTRGWVEETGTNIPLTATYGGFQGAKYADFPTYHSYCAEGQSLPNTDGGPEHLCTETLNRPHADLNKILTEMGGKNNGFVVWELMIGRDNCRYPWGHPDGPDEPAVPFHGVIYPDGHPWDVKEVRALAGEEAFGKAGLFRVSYHEGRFGKMMKESVTPLIEFKLGDEPGTGSPDASAGIGKDNFSMRWTGNFIPPESGRFTFSLASDGEVEMKIAGGIVAKGADGAKGGIELEKGKSYPMEIGYFHRAGNAFMRASWTTEKSGDTLLKAGRLDGSEK
ncbi:MAG: PA14 domain-containing protein [Verrucomicrobiota bacterium]